MHELLVSSLPVVGVDGAGASLVTAAGSREGVYGSDEVATELETLQLTLGEGPCVDAASSHSPVLVPDLDDLAGGHTGRWPAFCVEARSAGVRALFAFPLRIGAIAFGAVDLYRCTPGGLSDDQLGAALSAMDATALAVLDLRRPLRGRGHRRRAGGQPHRPPGSRTGHGAARLHHRGGVCPPACGFLR